MVEEHIGKKRRKEVRQAINLREEMKRKLIVSFVILGLGAIAIIVISQLMNAHILSGEDMFVRFLPMIVMIVVLVIAYPKMSQFWSIRDKYKAHLKRFNITKADMADLQKQDRA